MVVQCKRVFGGLFPSSFSHGIFRGEDTQKTFGFSTSYPIYKYICWYSYLFLFWSSFFSRKKKFSFNHAGEYVSMRGETSGRSHCESPPVGAASNRFVWRHEAPRDSESFIHKRKRIECSRNSTTTITTTSIAHTTFSLSRSLTFLFVHPIISHNYFHNYNINNLIGNKKFLCRFKLNIESQNLSIIFIHLI